MGVGKPFLRFIDRGVGRRHTRVRTAHGVRDLVRRRRFVPEHFIGQFQRSGWPWHAAHARGFPQKLFLD